MSKILIIITLGISTLAWFIYPTQKQIVLGSQAKKVADTKSLIKKFNFQWNQILNTHVDLHGNVNYLHLSKENKKGS